MLIISNVCSVFIFQTVQGEFIILGTSRSEGRVKAFLVHPKAQRPDFKSGLRHELNAVSKSSVTLGSFYSSKDYKHELKCILFDSL